MNNRKGYVYFNSLSIEVEVAMTREEIEIGLMGRESLPEDGGMLFVFDEECVQDIWMKNMLISLDVIWLDSKGIIIHIEKDVIPCDGYCRSFGPKSYSKFVIELNGGYTDRHNINIGDNVRMTY